MKSFVALALLCGVAAAEPYAATAVSGPETWKKYEVRGIQLGTSRVELKKKGFTCGKTVNSRCYKILDKRCDKGARCEVKTDAFGSWFELNGAKAQLDYISIATTDSDSALAYQIYMMFGPRQVLASDSTLGKALFAKYGEATDIDEGSKEDKVGGGRMLWWNKESGNNGPTITVDCNGTNMEGPQCSLDVSDQGVQSVERSKQQEINDKKKRTTQPSVAPEL